MLAVSLLAFKKQINAISSHIGTANNIIELLSLLNNNGNELSQEIMKKREEILNSLTNEKVFNYRANIISLYGHFEHFIEEIVKEYVKELNSVCITFQDYHPDIKKSYFDNWKILSERLEWPKFNYLDEKTLIKNLYETIIDNHNKILAECFIQNGGNYRHKIISEVFIKLGLKDFSSKLQKYPPLSSYFQERGLDSLEVKDLFRNIDDMVDRRNEIAHTAADNIISPKDYLELQDFVIKYADALNSYLNDDIFEKKWMKLDSIQTIKPINVFGGNDKNIPAFSLTNQKVSKNNSILTNTPLGSYPRFKKLIILSLRKEETDGTVNEVESVDAEEPTIISIKVNEAVNIHCKFKFVDNI